MKEDPFNHQLDSALDQLRIEPKTGDLTGFEREVWAEIALRDERLLPKLRRWLDEGAPLIARPVAFALPVLTVFLGVAAAVAQTAKYEDVTKRSMEERYVSSIHAILRSESHQHEPLSL